MTGTILQLPPGTRSGVIRTEDGSRVLFAACDVLGDFDALAVGHRVNFEVEKSRGERNAIRVLREPSCSNAPKKANAGPDLRYLGFDQNQEVRSYKFDAVANGQAPVHFVVTVELALLRKHRISVQEVPALCLRKLAADLKEARNATHELADRDLLDFASLRAVALERKRPKPSFGAKRSPPPPPFRSR